MSSWSIAYAEFKKESNINKELELFALELFLDHKDTVLRLLSTKPDSATLEELVSSMSRINHLLRIHNDQRQSIDAEIADIVQRSEALADEKRSNPVSPAPASTE